MQGAIRFIPITTRDFSGVSAKGKAFSMKLYSGECHFDGPTGPQVEVGEVVVEKDHPALKMRQEYEVTLKVDVMQGRVIFRPASFSPVTARTPAKP